MKKSTIWRAMMLVGGQVLLLGSGGTCLPENFFADTGGDIARSVIIAGFNILVADSGIQI